MTETATIASTLPNNDILMAIITMLGSGLVAAVASAFLNYLFQTKSKKEERLYNAKKEAYHKILSEMVASISNPTTNPIKIESTIALARLYSSTSIYHLIENFHTGIQNRRNNNLTAEELYKLITAINAIYIKIINQMRDDLGIKENFKNIF